MTCNGLPSSFFPSNFLYQLQLQSPMEESHPLLPTMPQDLRGGVEAMLGKRSPLSFEEMGGDDELSDDCSLAGEKKRRLNLEQVRTLEKNFELGTKLEPERKMQLARALGLQPRQIAIWFQNRRARWKTKTLEKDFEALKRQFDVVKEENDALHEQNKGLQAELLALKGREAAEPINLNKETEGCSSNRSENSSGINLDISRTPAAAIDIDSPPKNPNQGIIPFFPSYKQQTMNHLLQSSTTQEELHCPKTEHEIVGGQDSENFCSIFGGIEDQSAAFWAWSEQHNFHG